MGNKTVLEGKHWERPEAIDPSQVPVYPVVRLELTEGMTEAAAWGLSDGRLVAEGAREEVRRALLGEAAKVAARRPCGAVRVALSGFDAPSGVVTTDGQLLSYEIKGEDTPKRGSRGVVAAVVAAVVLGAGGLAGVAIATTSGWSRDQATTQAAPTPTPTQLPVAAPVGWAAVATWARPVRQPGTSTMVPSATIQGRGLVYVAGVDTGTVSALDEHTGQTVWTASVPGAAAGTSLAGGPLLASMGDRPVIVGWTSTQLTAWDAPTGQQLGTWSLGTATRVFTSGGRVVVTGQGPHAAVLDASRLQWRVLSAGATPMGATADGRLIAAGGGRAWVTNSNTVAGPGAALAGPPRTSWIAPVGALPDGTIVVAYSRTAGDGSVILRAFRPEANGETWVPIWTTKAIPGTGVSAVSSTSALPLWASPDGAYGVVGSTWINLRTGATRALPSDWQTAAVGSAGAFGSTAGGVGVVSATGVMVAPPAASAGEPTRSQAPVALSDAGTALVIAADGQTTSLYAVPPLRGSR